MGVQSTYSLGLCQEKVYKENSADEQNKIMKTWLF